MALFDGLYKCQNEPALEGQGFSVANHVLEQAVVSFNTIQ